jgi:Pellino
MTVQDISLGVSAPKWFDKDASPADRWRSFDALTTYGVKLWQPELREWCEISVQGNVSRPRTVFDEVGERLGAPFSNVLTDGSIIDICGAVLIFQSPVTMAKLIRKHVSTAYMTACTYTMTVQVNSCSFIIACHVMSRSMNAIAHLYCEMPGLLLHSIVLQRIVSYHAAL